MVFFTIHRLLRYLFAIKPARGVGYGMESSVVLPSQQRQGKCFSRFLVHTTFFDFQIKDSYDFFLDFPNTHIDGKILSHSALNLPAFVSFVLNWRNGGSFYFENDEKNARPYLYFFGFMGLSVLRHCVIVYGIPPLLKAAEWKTAGQASKRQQLTMIFL